MLVQLMTQGANATAIMSPSNTMSRGFSVTANTSDSPWLSSLQKLTEIKRTVSEKDVQQAAKTAGSTRAAVQLFRDKLRYQSETAQNIAQMQQAELDYKGNMSAISARVAQSQDKMVQKFAQAAYQIGNSAAYTQGITSAYASGLKMAANIV
jgi:hypothetical protein